MTLQKIYVVLLVILRTTTSSAFIILKNRIFFVGTRTNVLHVQLLRHTTYVACSNMIKNSNINSNSNMK